jgi:hypothetical protein
MPHYRLFGGCFLSELPFPELLSHVPRNPDWVLRQSSEAPPRENAGVIGSGTLPNGVEVRVLRDGSFFRVHYSDTGIFDISGDGSEIVWYPAPDADVDAARLDTLGSVFATAFHAAGLLCLHGSAVVLAEGGVGFVAPQRHGKSTLARALINAGARLATDDSLPVVPGSPPMMWPGVHQVRLWDDSAEHFTGDRRPSRSGYGGKHVLTELDDDTLLHEAVPLTSLYVLAPVVSRPQTPAVRRIRLSPTQASLALISHAKFGHMLGGPEAGVTLDRAGRIAAEVPIYRLEIARDFELLGSVVQELLAWHGGVGADRSVAGAA